MQGILFKFLIAIQKACMGKKACANSSSWKLRKNDVPLSWFIWYYQNKSRYFFLFLVISRLRSFDITKYRKNQLKGRNKLQNEVYTLFSERLYSVKSVKLQVFKNPKIKSILFHAFYYWYYSNWYSAQFDFMQIKIFPLFLPFPF